MEETKQKVLNEVKGVAYIGFKGKRQIAHTLSSKCGLSYAGIKI